MSRKSAVDAIMMTKPTVPAPAMPKKASASPAPAQAADPADKRPTTNNGAVGAVRKSMLQLAEKARAADNIESGSAIVEIDTALVDGSFVSDRITDATDASFAALVKSITEGGQQVPILVRFHPTEKGRYQVAFGHRRLRAAHSLGIKVRAIVKNLTDQELVVAQGHENQARRDLSFIEKALFAMHLEALGFERAVMVQAVGIDDSDLTRHLKVARNIPENIVRAIGPAPKAGRARWLSLMQALGSDDGLAAAEKAITEPSFKKKDSDSRFAVVLKVATQQGSWGAPHDAKPIVWKGDVGTATVKRTSKGASLSLESDNPKFAEFVVSQMKAKLDELHAAFRAQG
ncbi:plasmid partitioning protein RepB (plasmid) [Microvirga ossetica]|uniref:Plasmid partitioning protein RepB n=1 Tax=Microvirga ossetica TaxID=1882682 RepID=A0A1B2F013_9HYPH|nr:plasmid partitioning protein RepB [Microvirga ossetica]ANY85542.1 plasmid partitioning protein RepB [Microvirga ossetica]